MEEFFQKNFRSGHFAAPFLSQDWASDCHFIKALSREPLFQPPPGGGGGSGGSNDPPPPQTFF